MDLRLSPMYDFKRCVTVVFGPGTGWAKVAAKALNGITTERVYQICGDAPGPTDDQLYAILEAGEARIAEYNVRLAPGGGGLDEAQRGHRSELEHVMRALRRGIEDHEQRHPALKLSDAAKEHRTRALLRRTGSGVMMGMPEASLPEENMPPPRNKAAVKPWNPPPEPSKAEMLPDEGFTPTRTP